MTLKECFFIKNACFVKNQKINGSPVGIVVHSTGANNNSLKRYVQPVKEQPEYNDIIKDIGLNVYGNSWNRPDILKCVHAFIGVNAAGKVETYQTLPFDLCCWGVGSGKNGSFNYNPTAHLQFEICEDNLKDEEYFTAAMKEAIQFCAYLCNTFNIPANKIVSHKETYALGFGSNHGDIDYWLSKFGKNMYWFRSEVDKLILKPVKTIYHIQIGSYTVEQNAKKAAEQLQKLGYKTKIIKE